MTDLISRTELFNRLARVPIGPYAVDERAQIIRVINEMEPSSAVPIGQYEKLRHNYMMLGAAFADKPRGEWIEGMRGNGWNEWGTYTCPFCHETVEEKRYNFCPNCGADMRGDSDEQA